MATLRVPGWKDFQHYKERSPPWIKLHKKLLDNYEFHCLPVASRALAPMIWLLASESEAGSIEYASDKIAFRLRMSANALEEALIPLIEHGFIDCENDADELLAPRKRRAMPETEGESESEEETKADYSTHFEECRSVYPKRSGSDDKRTAFKAWNARLKEKHTPEAMIAGAKRYAAWCKHTNKAGTEFVMQMATFLGPSDPPHFTLDHRAPGQPAPVADAKPMPCDESLQPYADRLIAAFGIPYFNSWLARCLVVEKEDWITLAAPNAWMAREIQKTCLARMKKDDLFGDQFQVGHGRPKVDA
jgi:hypothetical protein